MKKFFIAQLIWKTIFVCTLLLSNTSYGADAASTRPLFLVINDRLEYMEDVALFKAQNLIPVENIEREQVVLEDAKALAQTWGLNAQSMEQFFIAQINAAKAIQYRYRAQALNEGLPGRSVDLNTDIRPALDRLGAEIVRLFAEFLLAGNSLEESDREAFAAGLRSSHLSSADKDALYSAMRQVRLAQ